MSSVLDELRTVEQRIASRMAELRPLVTEYQELERIAERLGIDVAAAPEPAKPATPKPPAATPKPKPKAKAKAKAKARAKPSAGRGTREVGAKRREQVLALIRERPGITVPDISTELGVDPPPLYRVVRKLQSEGVVSKEGKELRLV